MAEEEESGSSLLFRLYIHSPTLFPPSFGLFCCFLPGIFNSAVVLTATRQAQEKVAKREAAEAVEEKAREKLDKAKALLEEAKALVTVYVVTTRATLRGLAR